MAGHVDGNSGRRKEEAGADQVVTWKRFAVTIKMTHVCIFVAKGLVS